MITRVAYLASFVLLTLLPACNDDRPDARYDGEGISWEEAATVGEGTIEALYVPADGFAYEDENGQLTGVTVDILREFAAWAEETYGTTLNLNFYAEDDWQSFYDQVREADEGVIGMGNVTITEERRRELSFSPPYMHNIAVLISHEDRSELSSFLEFTETFPDHEMLAFEGTLHETRLRDLQANYAPEMEIEQAHSNEEILERVGAEDRYLAYIDVYNYWRARNEGVSIRRHEIGDDAAEEFGYILPYGSDWAAALEEFFQADGGFIHSDIYQAIMEKHLGPELTVLLLDQQTDI